MGVTHSRHSSSGVSSKPDLQIHLSCAAFATRFSRWQTSSTTAPPAHLSPFLQGIHFTALLSSLSTMRNPTSHMHCVRECEPLCSVYSFSRQACTLGSTLPASEGQKKFWGHGLQRSTPDKRKSPSTHRHSSADCAPLSRVVSPPSSSAHACRVSLAQ